MRIVDRHDDVHARVDLRAGLQAVGAEQRLDRHAVAARQTVGGVALQHEDRRAADGGPAAGPARNRRRGGRADRAGGRRRRRRDRGAGDRARMSGRLIGVIGAGACAAATGDEVTAGVGAAPVTALPAPRRKDWRTADSWPRSTASRPTSNPSATIRKVQLIRNARRCGLRRAWPPEHVRSYLNAEPDGRYLAVFGLTHGLR